MFTEMFYGKLVLVAVALLGGAAYAEPTVDFPDGTPLFAKDYGEARYHGSSLADCDDVYVLNDEDAGVPETQLRDWVDPYNGVKPSWQSSQPKLQSGGWYAVDRNNVPMYAVYITDFSIVERGHFAFITYLYRHDAMVRAHEMKLFGNETPDRYDYEEMVALSQRHGKDAEGSDVMRKLFVASLREAYKCWNDEANRDYRITGFDLPKME